MQQSKILTSIRLDSAILKNCKSPQKHMSNQNQPIRLQSANYSTSSLRQIQSQNSTRHTTSKTNQNQQPQQYQNTDTNSQKELLLKIYEIQEQENFNYKQKNQIIQQLDEIKQVCEICEDYSGDLLTNAIVNKIQNYQSQIQVSQQCVNDLKYQNQLISKEKENLESKVEELLNQNSQLQQQYLIMFQRMNQIDINQQFQKYQQQSYINKIQHKEYRQIKQEFYSIQTQNTELNKTLMNYNDLQQQIVTIQKELSEEKNLSKQLLDNVADRVYVESLIKKDQENKILKEQLYKQNEYLQDQIKKYQLLQSEQLIQIVNLQEELNLFKKQQTQQNNLSSK